MAKINIFYLFSVICTLLLIGYLWLVVLPLFQGTNVYATIRNLIIVLSLSLGAVVILVVYMSKPSTAPHDLERIQRASFLSLIDQKGFEF